MDVPQKAHARLGASNAARWMACPGSINLSAQAPVPPTTAAAEEGTTAHALAELVLRSNGERGTADYIGETIEGRVVDENMALAVAVHTDYCFEIMARPGVRFWIERKFSLASLKPPEPMFGTADFCAYESATKTLHVADLKFGAGLLVEVIDSKQLRYYALGALLSLLEEERSIVVEKIVMTIVQPRISHADGIVRSWTTSFDDLLGFAHDLVTAANATQRPDAPLAPGEHCRFCPASAICPARRDQAQALAQVEFAVVEPGFAPAPALVPIEQLAAMLPRLELVEQYIKDCRAHIDGQLRAGVDVPGYKLVATRPTRKWIDESAVEALIAESPNLLDPDEAFKRELRSPAQIEKILKKKTFGEKLGHLVIKKSGGTKMAPADDPSPAVTVTRGEEFLALPSGSED